MPYLQIGESKYGKPMLDRILTTSTSLDEGVKLTLVSLDATIRSNVTVGMPFDIAIYPRDSLVAPLRQEVTTESAYYLSFQAQWQAGLCQTFKHLPSLTWPRPI
jgi:putative proteasome-type protease